MSIQAHLQEQAQINKISPNDSMFLTIIKRLKGGGPRNLGLAVVSDHVFGVWDFYRWFFAHQQPSYLVQKCIGTWHFWSWYGYSCHWQRN